MSESKQTKPSQADGGKIRAKPEEPSRHQFTFETAGAERLDATPDEAADDTPSRLLDSTPSAILQRQPASPAVARTDHARPTFRGRDFAGVPAHTASHPVVQPKLTVGPAGDRFEQEADRVAEQVMAMPAPVVAPPAPAQPPAAGDGGKAGGGSPPAQRQVPEQAPEEEEKVQTKPLAAAITPLVRRAPEEEEEKAPTEQPAQGAAEEEDEIRTKRGLAAGGFEANDEFESRLAAQRGGGHPLPDVQRAFMEPRFGADFSGVRVHTGGEAAQLNRAVSARAFTHGQDIFLGEGQGDLGSSAGQRLLAHELTHVAQQGGDVTTPDRVSTPGEPAKLEAADPIAGLTLRNHIRPVGKAGSGAILRQASVQSETGQAEEKPGFWGSIGGGLMGEFKEDPTYAMMGVDLGVSLIPILDQASDVRDIIAHLYYLIFRKQYDRSMRWVGLVFTLIGLIPEVGSAIKSASKFIIKSIREALSHLAEILRPFQRLLADIVDLGRLRAYVTRNWDRWVAIGKAAWSQTVDRVTRVVNAIPSFLSRQLRFLRDGIARVREMAPQKLQEAFAWVRRQWDSFTERIGRRESGAGAEAAGTAGEVGHAHGVEPPGPQHTEVDQEIEVAVEGGIVEEAESTTRPARRPRPRRPTITGRTDAARKEFESLRDGYAQRLGVPPGGQVHHSIELQVLDKYPGVFAQTELNAFANMRGIATELAERKQLHNAKTREIWDRHYRRIDNEVERLGLQPGTQAYNGLVRRNLIDARDEIDHVLGQFFSEYRTGRPRSFR